MKKRESFTSPSGQFKYAYLGTPDTKYNVDGEYKVDLILTGKQAEEFKCKVDSEISSAKLINPSVNREAPLPYSIVRNDENRETGEIAFKFKLKAKGHDRKSGDTWENKPVIFDAKLTPITEDHPIYSGGTGKISFQFVPYSTPTVGYGVSLRLKAVQILELPTMSSKSFGFEPIEGFTQSSNTEASSQDLGSETFDF